LDYKQSAIADTLKRELRTSASGALVLLRISTDY